MFLPLALSTIFSLANAISFTEAIQNTPNLKLYQEIIKTNQAIADAAASGAGSKTVLVPSDDALTRAKFFQLDGATQQAHLRYHILNGSYPASKLSQEGGLTAHTLLESNQYAMLGGGANVVFASKFGDSGVGVASQEVRIYTGLGNSATVKEQDVEFDGGLIHVVDDVFALPETCSKTATKAKLTSLLTALQRTNLTQFVDTTPRITCFAPSDEAFEEAGSPEESLDPFHLTNALKLHTLVGSHIGYSDLWDDGQQLETMAGWAVVVRKKDGFIWINNVKVIKANIITSNGVAHVLDRVLSEEHSPTPTSEVNEGAGDAFSSKDIRGKAAVAVAVMLSILVLLR
ncbi:FAS1 domain-containing protein [Kalaharituber pfeilii]|nr:FAS1 domain-containing protein [Kalaharituber pfeilii]